MERTGVSRRAKRLLEVPWWVAAAAGAVVIALLAIPQALRTGTVGLDNYPWYVAPDGRVLRGLIIDQAQYFRLTDAFRGDAWAGSVAEPFSSRAVAPWVAARTGLGASTALTVVNVAALTGGVVALAALARRVVERRDAVAVTVAVFALSFPAFWYTGKGFVDAAAVGLVPVALLAAQHRRRVLGAVILGVAVATKETALIALVPLVVGEALDRSRDRPIRAACAATWVAGAAIGFVLPRLLVEGATVTFAPWLPPALVTVQQMTVMNLAGPGNLLQFLLTAGPGLLALALWLPGWSGRTRPERDALLPLVLGVVAPLLLGGWSIVSALFDGRTAWMSLPFAALLLGRWVAAEQTGGHWAQLRGVARRALLAGVGLVLAYVLVGSAVAALWGDRAESSEATPGGFASVPTASSVAPPLRESRTGTGRSVLDPPQRPTQTWLLDIEGTRPLQLQVGDHLIPGTATGAATVLVEGADEQVTVVTDGDWEAELVSVDAAMPWEFLSPLTGEDPTVLLAPGGLRRPVEVRAAFDDPDGALELFGNCGTAPCTPGPGGVVPAGTEAVVVSAAGAWELIPAWLRD